MGFGQAVKTVFSKYVKFEGRASRSEFWWWILFVTLVAIVLRVLDLVIGWNVGGSTWTVNVNGDTSQVDGAGPLGVLSSLWAIIVFLPTVSVEVRRLHDTDKSGWWWWLNVICCIGGLILFIFYLMPSRQGDNKYGPQPA